MVKLNKRADGFIDCYIEVSALNDLPGVKGALSNEFLDELTDVLSSHFGLNVISHPYKSRIQVTGIVDDPIEIKRAKEILKIFQIAIDLTAPRTKADMEVERSNEVWELRSTGQFFRSNRSLHDQNMVEESYKLLISKGAVLWEIEFNHFAVRNLKRGFFGDTTESIRSAADLMKFALSYRPK